MLRENYIANIEAYKEKNLKKVEEDKWRNKFHIQPPIGWLNDPNGLCYFNNEYHVYYQYSPMDPEGGLKFWGHYTSKDLVNWKEEDIALYPDKDIDRDGVYSGSALVKDNELCLFYTGNVKEKGDHDYILSGREQNVIMVKSKDGKTFSEKKLILTNKDFPENMTLHVRDPKVWKENETYYLVLGARGKDHKGYILIYKSKDLNKWEFNSITAGGYNDLGYMWECPDIFKLEDRDILLISPQGIDAKGYKYNNIYQSGYIIGNLNKDLSHMELEEFVELDRGFDFYAPQSFLNHDGRRIMIGWMGIPDEESYYNPTIDNLWQHILTLPRELSLREGKLIQKPVRELDLLRKELIFDDSIALDENNCLEIFNSNTFELNIELTRCSNLKINFREDCSLEYKDNIFKVNMGSCGYGRKIRGVEIENLFSIRIYSDNSSLEIFLNDGEEVFSSRIYNDKVDKMIKVRGEGTASIKVWNI